VGSAQLGPVKRVIGQRGSGGLLLPSNTARVSISRFGGSGHIPVGIYTIVYLSTHGLVSPMVQVVSRDRPGGPGRAHDLRFRCPQAATADNGQHCLLVTTP
jgi:hypothetical protein